MTADSLSFRDPKEIWQASTSNWIMTVSYVEDFTIGIFSSSNLKSWAYASNFTPIGLLSQAFECPNLLPIPVAGARPSSPQMYILYLGIKPGPPSAAA